MGEEERCESSRRGRGRTEGVSGKYKIRKKERTGEAKRRGERHGIRRVEAGEERSAAVTGRLLPIWLANRRIVVDRKFARPKLHR